MGLKDKLKQGADGARTKLEESRQASATRAESERQAKEEREADAERLERERQDRRTRHFEEVQRSCPLPIQVGRVMLAGGVTLFDDEFLVSVGKDWGWSSQKLSLTTQRVVFSRGRATKDQQVVYLTDIRDVRFHKPIVGYGSLSLETAGGQSIEGLPSAKNGSEVRDRLLALIHFARAQAQAQNAPRTAPAPARPESSGEDVATKLQQLGELRDSGVITPDEFETKKAELLARM